MSAFMYLCYFSLFGNDKGGRSEKLYMRYVYVLYVILDIFLCYIWHIFCVVYGKDIWIRYMDIWLWFMSHAGETTLLAQRPSTLVLMMINSCSYVY